MRIRVRLIGGAGLVTTAVVMTTQRQRDRRWQSQLRRLDEEVQASSHIHQDLRLMQQAISDLRQEAKNHAFPERLDDIAAKLVRTSIGRMVAHQLDLDEPALTVVGNHANP